MACDLLPGGPVSGHQQHDPIHPRQRCQGRPELVVLLLQDGDGIWLRGSLRSKETRRKSASDGRATRPADDQVGSGPIEPTTDVVGEPTGLRLQHQA